jgi:predicted nucleic acid-binding protein
VDAFDADVLVYAATPANVLGEHVRALFPPGPFDSASPVGVGSTLLYPEVLTKPLRIGDERELQTLTEILSRLDLHPVDEATARLAVTFGARYKLRAPDAVHLATAVAAGADRFITNNQRHFPKSIEEIDVTYPADLA